MIQETVDPVTWVKVQKPTFDLVGVILSSLSLTGIMAAIACALGAAFGVLLIRRRRREARSWSDEISLHLELGRR